MLLYCVGRLEAGAMVQVSCEGGVCGAYPGIYIRLGDAPWDAPQTQGTLWSSPIYHIYVYIYPRASSPVGTCCIHLTSGDSGCVWPMERQSKVWISTGLYGGRSGAMLKGLKGGRGGGKGHEGAILR